MEELFWLTVKRKALWHSAGMVAGLGAENSHLETTSTRLTV